MSQKLPETMGLKIARKGIPLGGGRLVSSGAFLNGHSHLPLDTQKSYFLSSKHRQEEFPASRACPMANAYFLDMYRIRSTMSSAGCVPASQLGFAPSVPITSRNGAFKPPPPQGGPGTYRPGVVALLKQLRLTVRTPFILPSSPASVWTRTLCTELPTRSVWSPRSGRTG